MIATRRRTQTCTKNKQNRWHFVRSRERSLWYPSTRPCATPTPSAAHTVMALSRSNESRRQPRRTVRTPEYCLFVVAGIRVIVKPGRIGYTTVGRRKVRGVQKNERFRRGPSPALLCSVHWAGETSGLARRRTVKMRLALKKNGSCRLDACSKKNKKMMMMTRVLLLPTTTGCCRGERNNFRT